MASENKKPKWKYVSLAQAASYLQVSVCDVREMIVAGELQGELLGGLHKRWVVEANSLRTALRTRHVPKRAPAPQGRNTRNRTRPWRWWSRRQVKRAHTHGSGT